ncbi:MAG: glycosyltransferase [Planctomycetes bacterium]|nr:glycosyltransferase [Planctomycetota bacterium]
MKILLSPLGTHGDVHPFVGMGIELARRGHDVTVIANPLYQSLIERSRLAFVPLGTADEFRQAINDPIVWHPVKGLLFLLGFMTKAMRPQYELIAQQHVPGQTVVVHSPLGFGARLAHEKLGVPLVSVHLAPSSLRSFVQPPVMPHLWLPRWTPGFVYRLIFWWADHYVVGPVLDGPLNEFRAELGLPAISRPLKDWLNSPQRILGLFPEWFAPMAPDWPTQTRLSDFPLFDERGLTELPADLAEFVNAGEPPIVFTPGAGMVHAQAFFQAALKACDALQSRGIFLTMYPEQLPARLPATVRHFRYIPFSDVFPRSAAVVHHGGIGTTAQGLAAGVPQLIMPLGYDQPDNADRLYRLGVGDSLAVKHFTGPNLIAALCPLLQPDVRERCRAIAARMAAERPLEKVCAWIEEMDPRTAGEH